jgi:hypothetical protein
MRQGGRVRSGGDGLRQRQLSEGGLQRMPPASMGLLKHFVRDSSTPAPKQPSKKQLTSETSATCTLDMLIDRLDLQQRCKIAESWLRALTLTLPSQGVWRRLLMHRCDSERLQHAMAMRLQ